MIWHGFGPSPQWFEPEDRLQKSVRLLRKVQDSNEDDAELEKEDTGDVPRGQELESDSRQVKKSLLRP